MPDMQRHGLCRCRLKYDVDGVAVETQERERHPGYDTANYDLAFFLDVIQRSRSPHPCIDTLYTSTFPKY
jgi:hypothetical protein